MSKMLYFIIEVLIRIHWCFPKNRIRKHCLYPVYNIYLEPVLMSAESKQLSSPRLTYHGCQVCGFHPRKMEIRGYWNCLWKCGKSGEIWKNWHMVKKLGFIQIFVYFIIIYNKYKLQSCKNSILIFKILKKSQNIAKFTRFSGRKNSFLKYRRREK